MTDHIRILYVDDEPDLLKFGKIFLERLGGFEVTITRGAPEAITLLKNQTFDVIISDHLMPSTDGMAILRHLKAEGDITPFILFSWKGSEEVTIEVLNNGTNFFLQLGNEPNLEVTGFANRIKAAVCSQRTEKQAKDSEMRIYDIINFLPDATFAIDREGKVISWNRAIEEMTGVPAHQILGKGEYEYSIPFYGERRPILIDLVSNSDEKIIQSTYAHIKKEGDTLIAETRLPRPLGRYSVLLGKASILYNDEGDVVGAIESIRDITEQKWMEDELIRKNQELNISYEEITSRERSLRATLDEMTRVEKELRESEEKFRKYINNAPTGIFITDEDGHYLEVNSTACEITGYSEKELLEMRIYDILPPESFEKAGEWFRQVAEKGTASGESLFRHKKGTLRYWSVDSVKISSTRIMAFVQDITGRKQAEESLFEANKKLRLLTGLTRHDIFNQLMIIQSYHVLAMDEPDIDTIRGYISNAHQVGSRIEATLGFTREYENFGIVSSGWQRIHTVIESAKDEINLGAISIYNEIPDYLKVYADPIIRKVFTTLMENSIRHGEKVTNIQFSCSNREGPLIIICADDGVGVPPEEKECIFEHGFGKNTGIGLFLAREILSITGLSIRECGEPGKEARFEILVPAGKYRFHD